MTFRHIPENIFLPASVTDYVKIKSYFQNIMYMKIQKNYTYFGHPFLSFVRPPERVWMRYSNDQTIRKEKLLPEQKEN
jgi:hypothetical protein